MNNQELYNDGVNILKSIYRKYIALKQISEEDAKKYAITLHNSCWINNKEQRILLKFMSLHIDQSNNVAYSADIVYVSLSDISIERIVDVPTELSNGHFEFIKPYPLKITDYDNYKEEVSLLAELYYDQKSIDKFEKNSIEFNKQFEEYNKKIENYTKKVEKLKLKLLHEVEDYEPKDDSGDSTIPELLNPIETIENNNSGENHKEKNKEDIDEESKKDYYEQLIDRLNAGNSEKKTYDFEWDETPLLNYADDSSLEFAYNLIERGNISLGTDEKKTSICITSYLQGFCDNNETNEDFFSKYEKDKHYKETKEAHTWVYKMGEPMNTNDSGCHNCKYQSCPKFLAAYILYLKNKGILKKKLIDRKTYRENNNVANGFFLFEWKCKNGLKKVDDKSFEFAKQLVNNDYVRIERCLKDGKMNIISLISCKDIQLSNMDFNKVSPKREWNNRTRLKRRTDSEPNELCSSYNCRLPSCALEVAGYIYYLKITGQEQKIQEDRDYYSAHKEEIDKEIEEKVKTKIELLKSKKEEKIQNITDSYEGKIENLNLTINSILESDNTNFHCIVAGDDEGERNSFIEKIIKLLKDENPKIDEVRRIPVTAFTSIYKYDTAICITKENKLVYRDMVSKSEWENIRLKRDRNNYIMQTGTTHRVPEIENNAIYILDNLKEFISYVRDSGDKYLDKYNIKIDIEALTNIALSNYIIINANRDEVDSFLSISQRLKFVYQNNIITLPTYSIDDMFDAYIKLLNSDLVEQLREGVEEYRKQFSEYVSVNKNFIPFNKKEMVNYIATYANTRNELVLPPNIYKKENLDKLIGLDDVKEKLKEFEKYMLFQIQAKANEIDIGASNMHMIFTGNPGTGKTTVARIMAKMLFDLGVIKENKLIEVERKDLIARYIGQTALKTAEVIDSAIGGVLFIDEAYTLANGSDNDYGREAIATLIKAMEDHKNELVVIFAGYRNEMKKFIDINPGISSRIGYTFDFPDYSVDELMQIFYIKLKNSGFEYDENIDVPLKRLCDYFSKRKNFGNGRFVDKVIQETLMKHALNSSDDIRLITVDDIPSIEELNQNAYKNNNSETSEEMLDSLIGMENIKKQLKEFKEYADFVKKAEKEKMTIPAVNMHMVFTGNPGTGKTTIARIIAKMLFDMEVIHENKLIEVERKDLIANYIGQTATKTAEVIERAMGGVLFIDEAYSLANPGGGRDYGSEAVATLIKAMEDYKGSFVVIFAGYRDEMKTFIDMNPGIASRIGYTFNFEDYSVEELTEIFFRKMKKYGFEFDGDIEAVIKSNCEYYSKRKNFGNGRFIDKLIQGTLTKHAHAKSNNIRLITESDIPSIEELNQNLTKNNSNGIEEMLNSIVGMKELKEEVLSFGNYIAFVKEAEKQKIKIPDFNMHMIFTGNPGTGKTTFARIIAKMLFDMEVIHENKLIEVERKDLVAGYVGQTAIKTNEVIEKAMGGVLFIDEAYTLARDAGTQHGFGEEAIATLIKAMEDHKGEFVVIFAGYKQEMKTFLEANPGIASRIGYTFNFNDYTDIELTEIFSKKVSASGMKIEDDVLPKVKEIMKYFYKVENIGNGRFVDKVFSKTLLNHSKRYAEELKNISYLDTEEIITIKVEDLPTIQDMTKTLLDGNNMIDPSKIDAKHLRKTAIHEVGHATVGYLLLNTGFKKITCTAEGMGSLGYVELDYSNDSYTHTKEQLLSRIKMLLAGIGAEEVFLGVHESGGSSDLRKATSIARDIITVYGMSDLGLAHVSRNNTEVERLIYDEENKILDKCFKEVKQLILDNKNKMERVVDYLIEHSEIGEKEFIEIFNSIEE